MDRVSGIEMAISTVNVTSTKDLFQAMDDSMSHPLLHLTS